MYTSEIIPGSLWMEPEKGIEYQVWDIALSGNQGESFIIYQQSGPEFSVPRQDYYYVKEAGTERIGTVKKQLCSDDGVYSSFSKILLLSAPIYENRMDKPVEAIALAMPISKWLDKFTAVG